ncbi:MAG: metallophosphatase [Bacteroidota bacterium]|nr:metallophosphatase [Bacteroidota bacterium]
MKKIFIVLFISGIVSACIPTGGPAPTIKPNDTSKNLTHIAIGSCCNQLLNMSIFKAIKNRNPDLYIAMGDNIYSDNILNGDFATFLQSQYDLLNANYDFKTLRANIPCIATWDDHDYGQNNAGAEFPYKLISKNKFLTFWNDPSTSDRRTHDGVYTSYIYGDASHKVQIIILDCRNFLNVISGEPISATSDTSKTILGATQWAWLQQELQKPAAVRIVVSSTQMCTEHNFWEAWANYPHEIERFFKTVKDANAEHLFVISGDVHYAEFSKRTKAGQYPIYDFTSSGLTHTENSPAANQYRLGTAYPALNFGMINIDWTANPITITWEACGTDGAAHRTQVISLDELEF